MKNIIITLIALLTISTTAHSFDAEVTETIEDLKPFIKLAHKDRAKAFDQIHGYMIEDGEVDQAISGCVAEATVNFLLTRKPKDMEAFIETDAGAGALMASILPCAILAMGQAFTELDSEEVIIDPIKEAEEAAAEQARIEAEEAAHQKRLAQEELERVKDEIRYQRLMDLNSRLDAIDSY